MARLGTGRYSDLLRRFLSIDGDPDVARDLVPDLNAVLNVHDLPEFAFLANERLCVGQRTQAAVAAQRGYVGLTVPADTLAIIEKIHSSASVAEFFQLVVNTGVTLSSAGNSRVRDTRWNVGGVLAQPSCVVAGANAVAGGTVYGDLRHNASGGTFVQGVWDDPIVLGPGTVLQVINGTDNVAQVTTIVWRERKIELFER